MEKFIFLERDGVINVRQDQMITSTKQFVILPFVLEAFEELRRA